MSRIARATQKIFASSASNNGVFGSAQDGTKVLSNDLATLQSKAAWLTGWLDAVLGASKFPPLEEFQSVEYVHSTQIAYLLQQGIPEYDADTTYYTNNIVIDSGTYNIYGSVTNGNIGNALSDTGNWLFLGDLSTIATGGFTFLPQTVTGTSKTYGTGDAEKITLRSNSGTLMTDTLPGTGTAVLPSGWKGVIVNNDASALLTISVASGATLDGASANVIILGGGQRCIITSDGSNYYSLEKPSRTRLAADTNIYVATTGSNSANSGLASGSAFLTLQYAWDFLQKGFDLNNHKVTINVAAGTYTAGISAQGQILGQAGFDKIVINGNTGSPSTYIISVGAAEVAFLAQNNCCYTIQGLHLQASGSGAYGVHSAYNSYIACGAGMEFGAFASGYHLYADNYGGIVMLTNYTINGAAAYHYFITRSGIIFLGSAGGTITVSGTPAFTTFAQVSDLGELFCESNTFSGSATGTRYSVTINGVIDTPGGGASYFPGNVAGSTATGGQYI